MTYMAMMAGSLAGYAADPFVWLAVGWIIFSAVSGEKHWVLMALAPLTLLIGWEYVAAHRNFSRAGVAMPMWLDVMSFISWAVYIGIGLAIGRSLANRSHKRQGA